MTYDEILGMYGNLKIKEADLSRVDPEGEFDGLYSDGKIYIRSDLPTTAVKACTLAEEIGHYYTTAGNILDQNKIENRKQERRARGWAYELQVPIDALLEAYWAGIGSRYELAEFLDVPENFLQDALEYYKEKYGNCIGYHNYYINFDPLYISEKIEIKKEKGRKRKRRTP